MVKAEAPAPRTVLQTGQALNLKGEATGTGTLSYRWKKNNRVVTGQTGATLSMASTTAQDAGAYTLEVTDAATGQTTRTTSFVLLAPAQTEVVAWGDNPYSETNPPAALTGSTKPCAARNGFT